MNDKTIVGDNAIVARVLEKVELAARQAVSKGNTLADGRFNQFADNLMKIIKDLR